MAELFEVNLGTRSYPITISADETPRIRTRVQELTAAGRKVAVLTDRNVAATLAHDAEVVATRARMFIVAKRSAASAIKPSASTEALREERG